MLNIGMLKNRVYDFFFTVYKFGNSYPGLGVVWLLSWRPSLCSRSFDSSIAPQNLLIVYIFYSFEADLAFRVR